MISFFNLRWCLLFLALAPQLFVRARLVGHRATTEASTKTAANAVDTSSSCRAASEQDAELLLSKEFMIHKVHVATHLSDIVNREEYGRIEDMIDEQRKVFERFDGFHDYNDQSLVAKTKDTQTCFVTFQSTDPGNGVVAFLMDQWQNVNPFKVRIGTSDCYARKGYVNAYNASSYKDEQRKSIDACVASCGDTPCPLVLSGFSQGGSAAVVAAADLAHYNPEVITFGAARVIVDRDNAPCTESINPANHYRFVTADTATGYDAIPNQINVWNERHVGHFFLLDADGDNLPLNMPSMDDNVSRRPRTLDMHDFVLYRERIEALLESDCFPLAVAKWSVGHYCRYDDECSSESCVEFACA
ncbi:expressed unknown protein [Seminavis robusta]|uniref:Fungal lipase-type domain-containing protein n=1 Tax=Seminavis robusta TaxID=568900 RepID=A0A9N8H8I4_9STRA|nr:expressed unknown protein [Seminavis robusta]|eukprot:Sro241_g096460.1 n/a (359) ;mRNA; r:68251-69554